MRVELVYTEIVGGYVPGEMPDPDRDVERRVLIESTPNDPLQSIVKKATEEWVRTIEHQRVRGGRKIIVDF